MADPKVVSLVKGGPHQPDPDVLAVCRALLRRAEAGELTGIAVAIDTREGTEVAAEFANGCRPMSMLGAVSVLHARVLRVATGEDEP